MPVQVRSQCQNGTYTMNNQPSTVVSIVTSILPFLKIDDVDVRNVSRQTAQNLLRFADQYAEIHALTMQGDEVSG